VAGKLPGATEKLGRWALKHCRGSNGGGYLERGTGAVC